ncbi:unnamed protein product [Rotaria sp. Silwood2]|nr:unnamed protein product [Rotaria sp. Silwood2]CAF4339982.1 unnamed protein product [Rotaria sp. Silwood2]
MKRVRELTLSDNNGNELSNIYVIFISGIDDTRDQNSSILSYVKFDLEKLINDIKDLPLGFHENRLQQISAYAVARVINIYFRCGYILKVMKYKVLADFAAVVSFLDLIPRYFAREHIRQNFSVNTQFKIEIDEPGFKTSALKNTFEFSNVSSGEKVKNVSSMVVKTAVGIATAGVSMLDDGLRAVAVAAVDTVHGLSVDVLLTTEMCAWSAVSNGK